MKLVWRLFLKDQRVLCWWIVVWIVFQVASAAAAYLAWKSYAEIPTGIPWLIGGVLVALLVHQEPVAMSRASSFWRTRPLQPRHLMLGKGLFVLLYFVLIPTLIQVSLLLLTGFRGYIGLALIEWGVTYFTGLLVVLALAAVTTRLASTIVFVILGWIGIAALRAGATFLKRQFEWQPEANPWWDFPTAPLVIHLVFALGSTIIILNQYITSNRKWSLIGLAMTMMGVAGVSLLPLIPHAHGSHAGKLPPSDPALDAAAEDLVKDLNRLSPLPPRYGSIGERNGLSINRMERFLERSKRADARLSLTVNQSRTEVHFEKGIMESINPHPMTIWNYTPHEEFVRAVGNEDLITSYTQAWPRIDLMEYDMRDEATFKGQVGTLHSEFILTRAEPEFSFRIPLVKGAEVRNGPFRFSISNVRKEGKELRIQTTEYVPRRKWTAPWTGLPSRGLGGNSARLYHVPSKTVLSDSLGISGGSSSSKWPSLWARLERDGSFDTSNGGFSFEVALLAPENFDASEWELVGVTTATTAAKRVPIEIPHFRIGWTAAETVEEFQERLEKIHLSDFESAEAFLWEVWYNWSDNLPRKSASVARQRTLILEKLSELRPEHLGALMHVFQSRPYGSHDIRPVMEAVKRLIGPEHKELVLANHDPTFDLLDSIIDQGWEQEALPIMVAKAQPNYFTPPKGWLDFLLKHRPLDKELWFNMAKRDFKNQKIRDAVAKIPDFPYERLVDLRWEYFKHQSWWLDPFKDVLTFGRPYALPTLRYIVKARHYYRSSEPEPPILVELLSTMSDCPNDLEQAEAWLETHAETATFDPETKRYVTAQPKEAP